jgi:hypothetical protein
MSPPERGLTFHFLDLMRSSKDSRASRRVLFPVICFAALKAAFLECLIPKSSNFKPDLMVRSLIISIFSSVSAIIVLVWLGVSSVFRFLLLNHRILGCIPCNANSYSEARRQWHHPKLRILFPRSPDTNRRNQRMIELLSHNILLLLFFP